MAENRSNRRDFLRMAAGGAAAIGLGVSRSFGRSDMNTGDIPPRATGQQSVMGLACEPMDTVRIGVIGLGMRGMEAVGRLLYIDGVHPHRAAIVGETFPWARRCQDGGTDRSAGPYRATR